MTERSSVLDLQDYGLLARRRWRWLIIVPLSTVALVMLITLARTPVYTASAEVVVLTESSRSLFPFTTTTAGQLARNPLAELQFLNGDRYRRTLSNPEAVSYELAPIDPEQRDSDVIRFTAEAPSADAAASLADKAAQQYLALRHEQDISQLALQAEQLDAVLDELAIDVARPGAEEQSQVTNLERAALGQALTELEAGETAGRIHNPAVVPDGPTSPDLVRNLLLGVIAGGVLGLGLAVLRELFDTRAFDPDTVVSAVNAPILGVIGVLPRRTASATTPIEQGSAADTAYRTVLNSVWLWKTTPTIQTLVVTGARSGVGVTETAVNLAMLEASQGTSVLLIDANVPGVRCRLRLDGPTRAPVEPTAVNGPPPDDASTENAAADSAAASETVTDSNTGSVSDGPGDDNGHDLLAGVSSYGPAEEDSPDDDIIGTLISTLDVLGSLDILQGVSDLLRTDWLDRRLEKLRSRYDLIIVDAQPTLGAADVRPLASRADAVIVVYDPNEDRLDDLHQTVEVLRSADTNVAGLVANRATAMSTRFRNAGMSSRSS